MSGPSTIARSLTTRINRKKSVTDGSGSSGGLGRAFSMRKSEKQPPRPEISLPIELVSATNPLAFNAPDLPHLNSANSTSPVVKQLTAVSSSASLRSEGSVPALSSAASTTFTFSGLSTPTDELPEHLVNDLQSRLAKLPENGSDAPSSPQSQKSHTTTKAKSPLSESTSSPAPAIPKRAPSHTKKTHQALARQRSMSRVRSESIAAGAPTPVLTSDNASRKSTSSSPHHSLHSSKDAVVARSSAEMFSARSHVGSGIVDAEHPFGAELAKLTEVAEEFSPHRAQDEQLSRSGARSSEDSDQSPLTPAVPRTPGSSTPIKHIQKQKPIIEPTVWDEEQEFLSKHGLRSFSAEEYMAEIGSPYTGSFPGIAY